MYVHVYTVFQEIFVLQKFSDSIISTKIKNTEIILYDYLKHRINGIVFENVVAQYLGVFQTKGWITRSPRQFAISSEAIEMANREVENVHAKKVRGPYKRYVVFTCGTLEYSTASRLREDNPPSIR